MGMGCCCVLNKTKRFCSQLNFISGCAACHGRRNNVIFACARILKSAFYGLTFCERYEKGARLGPVNDRMDFMREMARCNKKKKEENDKIEK